MQIVRDMVFASIRSIRRPATTKPGMFCRSVFERCLAMLITGALISPPILCRLNRQSLPFNR